MLGAHTVTLSVNGTSYTREIEPTLLLVEFLRETLNLTGTHVGCDTSQCGACTVLVDGRATKACTMLAVQTDGAQVITVEGLAKNAGAGAPGREATLHPIQRAFAKEHGLQCGFCTPGLMITAVDFLERNASPTDAEIRHAIEGNLGRCTSYHNRERDPFRVSGDAPDGRRPTQGRRGGEPMTATANPTYIGARVARKEDPRLITGEGTFTDDVMLQGMAYLTLVRSPHAHARIRRIDTAAAKKEPGVVAVLTGKDLEATGMLPVFITVPSMNGSKHMPIATDKARYAGDAVAAVVADSRDAAKRAADLIAVDYEPLAVVVDASKALEPGAPIVHEELGSNLVFTYPVKGGDVDKAFKDAEVKVSQRIVNQRLIPNAMEPRAVAAKFEAGELTLWSSTQIPHFVQLIVALNLGLGQNKVRVIAPEVGGGFGSKLQVYAEELLVGHLAKTLGRPVKWTEERREGYLATIHGRDHVSDVELAAKKDGTILGLRVRTVANVGAYLQAFAPGIPTILHVFIVPGPYRIPAFDYEMRGAYTNTTPVDAYRGAGRPEAAFLIERIMDRRADEIGMDPAEVRRKNFIPKDAFPFNTISGITYDSGDYAPALDRALAMADYKGFEKRRAEAKARGNYRGIGISSYVEICGLAPSKAQSAP